MDYRMERTGGSTFNLESGVVAVRQASLLTGGVQVVGVWLGFHFRTHTGGWSHHPLVWYSACFETDFYLYFSIFDFSVFVRCQLPVASCQRIRGSDICTDHRRRGAVDSIDSIRTLLEFQLSTSMTL